MAMFRWGTSDLVSSLLAQMINFVAEEKIV
jgi:hypothetical protein